MNIHVYHVSSKCFDALLEPFMYCLGNVPIGYEEIWQFPILLSQKRRKLFKSEQGMPFLQCLAINCLKNTGFDHIMASLSEIFYPSNTIVYLIQIIQTDCESPCNLMASNTCIILCCLSYTCSIPRCPLCSRSLVCSENHLFIVGILPIRDKEI